MRELFDIKERGVWYPGYPLDLTLPDSEVELRDLDFFKNLLGKKAKENKACVYIDIPFCDSFCAFCAFPKVLRENDLVERYLSSLMEEIKKYSNTKYVNSLQLSSVYFGGGTPTAITSEQLKSILICCKERLNLTENVEITIEAATHNCNREKLKELFEAGANRISFGVQTFKDPLRRILDIQDSAEEVIERVLEAREVGFQTVDIDLIYNLPGQTFEDFKKDLEIASQLGLENISINPLHVEKGTKLARRLKARDIPSIQKKREEIEMFQKAVIFLDQIGYEPQSILKFIRSGKKHIQEILRLSHNDCLALGNHAQGNLGDYVCRNANSPETYCRLLEAGEFPIVDGVCSSKEDQMRRYMARGLALMKIEKERFLDLFGVNPEDVFPKLIKELEEKGLIYNKKDEIQLTSLGLIWGENVCTSFCSEEWNPQRGLNEAVS